MFRDIALAASCHNGMSGVAEFEIGLDLDSEPQIKLSCGQSLLMMKERLHIFTILNDTSKS